MSSPATSNICKATTESSDKVSDKRSKKTKRHKTDDNQSERPKTKKHKKAHAASDPKAQFTHSLSEHSTEKQGPGTQEPAHVKKKKKKPLKEGSKHKNIPTKCASEMNSNSDNQVDRFVDITSAPPSETTSQSKMKPSDGFDLETILSRESGDNLMVPISPEAPVHSRSGSSAAFDSPARSSRSHFSSNGSRSPYDHTSHRAMQRPYRDSDSRGTERQDRCRGRYKRDAHYDNPRRTYVAYRASRSRDSSPGTYYSGQSHRYQRDSSKADHVSRPYNHDPHRHSHRFRPRTRSRSSSYHRSRSRSLSHRHERHQDDRRDRYARRSRNSTVKYSRSHPSREPESEEYYHPPHNVEVAGLSKHRSPREPRSPRTNGKRDEFRREYPGRSAPKKTDRFKVVSQSEKRYLRRSESRSPEESRRTSTDSKHRRKTHKTDTSDTSKSGGTSKNNAEVSTANRGCSSSPKPLLTERTRKHTVSSKVSSILELLDEVNTDAVSDTELEVILPPEMFTKALAEQTAHLKGNDCVPAASGTSACPKEDKDATRSSTEPTSSLASLDNLSSKIREQLSEPEPWDSAELFQLPSQDDDSDNSKWTQSLVNLASVKKVSAQTRLSLTTLITQWQELIDSTTKNESTIASKADLITPFVPVKNIFNYGTCHDQLIPIQERASGASALRYIGVSSRYLGSELMKCLQNELSNREASVQSRIGDPSQPSASVEAQSQLDIPEISWMQRTPQLASLDSLTSPSSWNPIVRSSGALCSFSDELIRQRLLGCFS